METLDQNERKQQQAKTKRRANWAKRLVTPRTAKFLLKVGPRIAQLIYWVIRLIELIRS